MQYHGRELVVTHFISGSGITVVFGNLLMSLGKETLTVGFIFSGIVTKLEFSLE